MVILKQYITALIFMLVYKVSMMVFYYIMKRHEKNLKKIHNRKKMIFPMIKQNQKKMRRYMVSRMELGR